MKIQPASTVRPRNAARKTPGNAHKKTSGSSSGWLGSSFVRTGVSALACLSALRPAAATCQGFNPLQSGWNPMPPAWPDNTTYGEVLSVVMSPHLGPACLAPKHGYNPFELDFGANNFMCGNDSGVGFCSHAGDLDRINRLAGCATTTDLGLNWGLDQPMQTINNCGVQRAFDCAFFVSAEADFAGIEDAFVRGFMPTCTGFNPEQPHWTGSNATWSEPIDVSGITSVVQSCDTGPACGSAFNYDLQGFSCAGQAGVLVGQADLPAALGAVQTACGGNWSLLPQPPSEALFPYNGTDFLKAWDVAMFFTENGSSNLDPGLTRLVQTQLVAERHHHDAVYMARTAQVAGSVGSLGAIGGLLLARGSAMRRLGIAMGMGYAAGALGVAAGGLTLGWPRMNGAEHAFATLGVAAGGVAYLGAVGWLVAPPVRDLIRRV